MLDFTQINITTFLVVLYQYMFEIHFDTEKQVKKDKMGSKSFYIKIFKVEILWKVWEKPHVQS